MLGSRIQIEDTMERRAIFQGDEPVARDRFAGLDQRSAVGEIKQLDQLDARHRVAVLFEQHGRGLRCLCLVEYELHRHPPFGLFPVCSTVGGLSGHGGGAGNEIAVAHVKDGHGKDRVLARRSDLADFDDVELSTVGVTLCAHRSQGDPVIGWMVSRPGAAPSMFGGGGSERWGRHPPRL